MIIILLTKLNYRNNFKNKLNPILGLLNMKTFYISLFFFAILLAFLVIMFFIEIPAPSKFIVETFNLELR